MARKKKQTEPPSSSTVRKMKGKRRLKTRLTDEELLSAGQQVALLQKEREDLDLELVSCKKQPQSKIAEKDAAIRCQMNLLRDKHDYREIDVEEVWDNTVETCIVTRLDTDEVVESRKLTAEERQGSLFDE